MVTNYLNARDVGNTRFAATSAESTTTKPMLFCALPSRRYDPQRDSLFTKGPSDVLDHATNEIASGSKPGIYTLFCTQPKPLSRR